MDNITFTCAALILLWGGGYIGFGIIDAIRNATVALRSVCQNLEWLRLQIDVYINTPCDVRRRADESAASYWTRVRMLANEQLACLRE